jgi:2-amino-4-hydroxy-6-hydroxymethyldihydropteridine diphosphokinase
MTSPTAVYVAAGSNLDPERNLAKALELLAARFGPLRVSKAYRNAAVGFEGPDFVNLVVGFETHEPVRAVLETMRGIEEQCGRRRSAPKWASRTMDLDILLYGDLVCDEPDLKLPRPGLLTRAFMLGPIAELAGDVVHPVVRRSLRDLWREFDQHAHPMQEVPITNRDSALHRPPGSGR